MGIKAEVNKEIERLKAEGYLEKVEAEERFLAQFGVKPYFPKPIKKVKFERKENGKLDWGKVREIRNNPDVPGVRFAAKFNVIPQTIYSVRAYKTWKPNNESSNERT